MTCARCSRRMTAWMLDGVGRELCLPCHDTWEACTQAIVAIRRWADSVHAGGIVARLEEVAARADAV